MRLLIFGAGGHARVACQIAERMGTFDAIAFSCCNEHPDRMMGYTIFDEKLVLGESRQEWDSAFVAIGNNAARKALIERVVSAGYSLVSLVDPTALVSGYAEVSPGTIVCPNAVINPYAKLGIGCIVNTAAVVEHDCELEDFVHLSPNVALGGGVFVGELSWCGIGSCVVDHVSVCSKVILGAGACLVENALVPGTYVGVPAKRIGG